MDLFQYFYVLNSLQIQVLKTTTYNIARIEQLILQYRLEKEEFMQLVSEGLKNTLIWEDIFQEEIQLNHLKRIDKIFTKGLSYYLDPNPPAVSKEASIFYRKEKFGADLNLAAKKVVNQFEELKISLSGLAKLSDLKMERMLPVFATSQDPEQIANEVKENLSPKFKKDSKKFLKALIQKLAEANILVFEYVEYHNQKLKSNIDGVFLHPNVIVLKINQDFLKREIFTLAHELGHYLLNQEEVEAMDYDHLAFGKLNKVESWCNSFAFAFLAGDKIHQLDQLPKLNAANDYNIEAIKNLSNQTQISFTAILTYLVKKGKLSGGIYGQMKRNREEEIEKKKEEDRKKRELEKEMGIKSMGGSPKPIQSPLFVSTIQAAFFDGVINEYDLCKALHLKPDQLEKFLR